MFEQFYLIFDFILAPHPPSTTHMPLIEHEMLCSDSPTSLGAPVVDTIFLLNPSTMLDGKEIQYSLSICVNKVPSLHAR